MLQDSRVSAYIETTQPFARPILKQVRAAVHAAVPDAVVAMKWSMPFFTLHGRNIAMMAAFKAHAGVGIFDGSPIASKDGMGKLASVDDLPADLAARLATAAVLAVEGKPTRMAAPRVPKSKLPCPMI